MTNTVKKSGMDVRVGQAPAALTRAEFHERFMSRFYDPAYAVENTAISRLEEIAWQAVQDGRKSPVTQPAGPEFADPTYPMSVQWMQTRQRLRAADKVWHEAATQSRVLVICGSARNDGTCPGEASKTWRMTELAQEVIGGLNMQADVLDLSLVTSEYGRNIHPCKGCVSSAMPLCHWPCSCYPNHALNQTSDWMAEIYERWTAAHGVIILAPTYWYQSPSPLKLMIDRLVCADGGNADPTTTHGKNVAAAKALEAKGWDFPKHMAGRAYGVVVHGDVAGVEVHRRNLCDWLEWMGLIDSGAVSKLDRYVGYYEPYWNSHDALDADAALQEEVRNVARSVGSAVAALRAGQLSQPDKDTKPPRPK